MQVTIIVEMTLDAPGHGRQGGFGSNSAARGPRLRVRFTSDNRHPELGAIRLRGATSCRLTVD
jgi:hypothetical protein